MQATTNNLNEWINWIEQANLIKRYKYEDLNDIEEIGSGSLGTVYRANWKNFHKYLALKSFFNLNNITAKEIIDEIKLQREVNIHENIIRFYGIVMDNQNDPKKWLIVMEYADSGTLQNYLAENFENLTWNDKFNMAFQLAYAVSYLHDEGIVHRDLHSGNILVHQNTIKLADLGFSKRIMEASNPRFKLFGVIPYIDPISFSRGNSLNEKSDVYSVGVLLWEISSGRLPFHNEPYDIALGVEILNHRREIPIPNTPEDYIKIYTDCWNSEPNNRPEMKDVVFRLDAIITKNNENQFNMKKIKDSRENIIDNPLGEKSSRTFNKMNTKINITLDEGLYTKNSINNSLLYEESSQTFNKTNPKVNNVQDESSYTKNIDTSQTFNNANTEVINEDLNTEKEIALSDQTINEFDAMDDDMVDNLSDDTVGDMTVDMNNVVDKTIKFLNKVKESEEKQCINNCLNEYNVTLQEIYNWLVNNQDNSNAIVLLGKFNHLGIGTSVDEQKAFELYQKAVELRNASGMNYLGHCYENGIGASVDKQRAFELYQKAAELEDSSGINNLGYCYDYGIGTSVDKEKAFSLYQKANELGHRIAKYNLGQCYEEGNGVDKDHNKAFKLYNELAEDDYPDVIYSLGYCYQHGIGTNIDVQKALKLYQMAADLGYDVAQYNLAQMYANGEGVDKDYNKAFELFIKLAEKECPEAMSYLGYYYQQGIGTMIDKQKAFELFQKAANLGNNIAQYNLGFTYEEGYGIEEDITQAVYWYEQSAKNGLQEAKDRLKNLKKRKRV